MRNAFQISKREGLARVGRFDTPHGAFDTPNFMPVGTRGSVKGVNCKELREIGTQVTLVNTYHLWLRPGHARVAALGGIHKFCGWSGPILSDSGGFQVFSLRNIRVIGDQGVEFRSHIDGARCFLTPELALEIQETLGVDIAMVLDECPAGGTDREKLQSSLNLTVDWAKRCLAARKRSETALFAITQGGTQRDLRTQAAERLGEMPFDGFAVGGLSVGEKKDSMYEVLSYHPQQLPTEQIRYLMGVGTPEDIVEAVNAGIDLFDCVMPTRSGRFGRAFVSGEQPTLNIRNSAHAQDSEPLDANCGCVACRNYSRGYLHHLFNVHEMLGPQLLSIHNLTHYLSLMREIRTSINAGTFGALYRTIRARWQEIGDEKLRG